MNRYGSLFGKFINLFQPMVPKINKYNTKVLYGYQWNHGAGTYLHWIFEKIFDVKIDYVIDDNALGGVIYRKNLLDYLDCDNTVIISACDGDKSFIGEYGYIKDKNFFDFLELTTLDNIGYFEYLEKKFGIDIIKRSIAADIKTFGEDYSAYAVSRGMGIPITLDYLSTNYPKMSVLDIGCGKGGALIAFNDFGYEDVDGIEIMEELCNTAKYNIKKMGLTCNVECKNALEYKNYDKYNLYYMYDPFKGEAFSKVIHLIENSVIRKPRRAVIVYSNPWEHRRVVEKGIFKLVSQLDGDWFTRMANIYECNI